MAPDEIEQLNYAKSLLESKGITAQLSAFFGIPIEKGLELLPSKWSGAVNRTIQKALGKALKYVSSFPNPAFG